MNVVEKMNFWGFRAIKLEVAAESERALITKREEIAAVLDPKSRRLLKCAQEKGASSWLSALPPRRFGYTLNKQEDTLYLRYGWRIPDMPAHCGCETVNSIDHILICKKGGYVIMRHNALGDAEARIMQKVCSDVRVEPGLLETDAGNDRPDLSARGVWSKYERTFFDVKVMHPTAS